MTQRDNLFFAVGSPKSGTTFLQRMLNMHPEVSCPSEQQIRMLRAAIDEVFDSYQEVLQRVDDSTGGQGAPKLRLGTRSRAFRDVVLRLSIDFARGKPIHGLNDNEPFQELPRYDEQFDHPRIVVILRDPVDIAVSAWRHSHRLARLYPDKAKMHMSVLQNPKGSLEGFVEKVVHGYRNLASKAVDYAAERDNIALVRYEALVADTAAELTRVLSFLGADTDPGIVDGIAKASSKEAMATASTSPGFFGVGKDAEPPVRLPDDFRQSMRERWLSPQLEEIGYRRD